MSKVMTKILRLTSRPIEKKKTIVAAASITTVIKTIAQPTTKTHLFPIL